VCFYSFSSKEENLLKKEKEKRFNCRMKELRAFKEMFKVRERDREKRERE